MTVNVVSVELAMVSVVGFLYGIFFVLFCASAYLLVQRQSRANASSTVTKPTPVWMTMPFVGGLLLFMTVTPHWITIVYRSFEAFIYYSGGTDPYAFYTDVNQSSFMAQLAFSVLVPLLADTLLIWRLWLIWDKNILVTVGPLLLLVGTIVSGIGALGMQAAHNYAYTTWNSWMTSFYVLSTAVSLLSSALITQKMVVKAAKSNSSASATSRVLGIFVESAALYVMWMVASLALYQTQNAVREALIPMAGIAFMLVNVRVGMGYTVQERGTASHALSDLSGSGSGSGGGSRAQAAHVVSPIAVNISHSVSRDMDAQSGLSEKVGEGEGADDPEPPKRVDISAV